MSDHFELPSQRRHRRQLAEAEKIHGIQWSPALGRTGARRLKAILRDHFPTSISSFESHLEAVIDRVLGHSRLEWNFITVSQLEDCFDEDDADECADLLDALGFALRETKGHFNNYPVFMVDGIVDGGSIDLDGYFQAANEMLEVERIGLVYIDGRIADRDRLLLHSQVIEPLEAVLVSDLRFGAAATSYATALRHLDAREYASSITAMASALQDAFLAIGAQGNALGNIASDAKRRGLISGHDVTIITSLSNWANAERSNRGNAHGAGDAEKDDARFALHVIGAVILRLSQVPTPRDPS